MYIGREQMKQIVNHNREVTTFIGKKLYYNSLNGWYLYEVIREDVDGMFLLQLDEELSSTLYPFIMKQIRLDGSIVEMLLGQMDYLNYSLCDIRIGDMVTLEDIPQGIFTCWYGSHDFTTSRVCYYSKEDDELIELFFEDDFWSYEPRQLYSFVLDVGEITSISSHSNNIIGKILFGRSGIYSGLHLNLQALVNKCDFIEEIQDVNSSVTEYANVYKKFILMFLDQITGCNEISEQVHQDCLTFLSYMDEFEDMLGADVTIEDFENLFDKYYGKN